MGWLDGDAAGQRLAARIKAALDPENILSPGRYQAVAPRLAVVSAR
jgi:hypothetical protein